MDRKQFAFDVIDACKEIVWESHGVPKQPKRLYHFTDAEGFEGIIASHNLWLSLATALNDAEEVRHSISIAKVVVADRLVNAATPYEQILIGCINNPTREHFNMSFEAFEFVLSFCAQCDKASQWLHYGRSGTGVALGFAPELADVLAYFVEMKLMPIDYNGDSQKARIERLIDAGYRVLMRSGTPEPWMCEAAAHLVSILMPVLAVQMKHPSFADEGEWRIVHPYLLVNGNPIGSNPPNIKTRRRGATLIPYIERSFGSQPETLEKVVVGYSSPLGLDAVRLLLSEQGMYPLVQRSEVPVR
jgi:hypothetical protein